MSPSRGQQGGITVLKKNGSSVTHNHLTVSPAKEHPTPSKCTNFSWHESSCWHTAMSTLNLSVKALKKPENCLHKKPPLPRHDRSSPSKDAPRAAPKPCWWCGGWEEGEVNAWSPKDEIRGFFGLFVDFFSPQRWALCNICEPFPFPCAQTR